MKENTIITFIIPTIGRSSLINTLQCLKNQININWKAIVIFDGIPINIVEYDSRIKIIQTPNKLGHGINGAGLVRNYGIKFVDTEWIAFVDDDDGISSNYIDLFLFEVLFDPEVILFRMLLDDRICPKNTDTNFYKRDVGISFAVKTEVFNKFKFIPSWEEDFYFLHTLRENNYKIMLSPYVTYFVNNNRNLNTNITGTRGFINY
jgi:glycosyltransferase involved in cell wall biosynthesis